MPIEKPDAITTLVAKVLGDVAEQKEKLPLMRSLIDTAKKLGEPVEGAEAMLSAMELIISATEKVMKPISKPKE